MKTSNVQQNRRIMLETEGATGFRRTDLGVGTTTTIGVITEIAVPTAATTATAIITAAAEDVDLATVPGISSANVHSDIVSLVATRDMMAGRENVPSINND